MESDIKTYNKKNYYRNTYAVFKEVASENLPFKKWHYTSKSGSAYYYTKTGIYRLSNHWGRAAKCRWVLESGNELYVSKGRVRIGYANWTDFFENIETTQSYFIKVDFTTKSATYDHKSRDSSATATYRTAKETQKLLQKVKRLLKTDNWSKYYEYEDLEVLRKELVLDLIR